MPLMIMGNPPVTKGPPFTGNEGCVVLLSDLGGLGGQRVGLSLGQVVELSRNANTLHIAGKTCGVVGGALASAVTIKAAAPFSPLPVFALK